MLRHDQQFTASRPWNSLAGTRLGSRHPCRGAAKPPRSGIHAAKTYEDPIRRAGTGTGTRGHPARLTARTIHGPGLPGASMPPEPREPVPKPARPIPRSTLTGIARPLGFSWRRPPRPSDSSVGRFFLRGTKRRGCSVSAWRPKAAHVPPRQSSHSTHTCHVPPHYVSVELTRPCGRGGVPPEERRQDPTRKRSAKVSNRTRQELVEDSTSPRPARLLTRKAGG